MYYTTSTKRQEDALYYLYQSTRGCTILSQVKHKRMHYITSTETQEDVLYYLNQNTTGCTILPQPKHNRMHNKTPNRLVRECIMLPIIEALEDEP